MSSSPAQRLKVEPAQAPLHGELRLPGDKSIAHRALILAALATGESTVAGLPDGEDVASTRRVLQGMGVEILEDGPGVLRIEGVEIGGLRPGPAPLDCGNSGTSVRLLAGAVAQGEGTFVFTGDVSLSRRPMERIAAPLRAMGVQVEPGPGGGLPLQVSGPVRQALDHTCPVASAQVKSAVLLAGLAAPGRTIFRAPAASRNHTERMLRSMGWPVEESEEGRVVSLVGQAGILRPLDLKVPGDPSSAAFHLVAASLLPGSELNLEGVLANRGRLSFLDWLVRMGAPVEARNESDAAGEPVATLRASFAGGLSAVEIHAGALPSVIDEVPILAVAAAHAEGTTVFRGAGELRHKESDRLQAVIDLLGTAGIAAHAEGDDLFVEGEPGLRERAPTGTYEARGDHRLAMAATVLALTTGGGEVSGAESIAVSYPAFVSDLSRLGAQLEAHGS
ncbi:MAG: 3-phosphoshikimate 1-carboxyvinyltransferase [Deltaproteobacteria bacterium]|nr:3-phosphoshikimate 1-carboxyvinyltransferase [Deltaproteobacteria bacterium]